jgi:cellulose synthase/poly-beta-1,6-N-acetylglucosamine synthase-like glycosyltransferase
VLSALHFVALFLGGILVALTLPLAIELLVLSLAAAFPSRRQSSPPAKSVPLAVIIPAHNEQKLIRQCIASLASPAASPAAIYVIAHNCTDSTAQCAAEAGAQSLVLNDSVGGKGIALDFGFRHAIAAGAEAVLVIDADSIAAPNIIAAVSAAFAAGAEAVQCRYQVANSAANPRTRLAALALLGMNVLRPLGRHRLGLSCGIFGNGFALSARTLAKVPYTPNSLVEDLEYHLHLIRAGIRVEFLNHTAVFGEMPESGSAAASQRARWEGGRILMRRLWTRPLALEVLRGRMRMLEPLLDLLALPLATQAVLLVLIAASGIFAHGALLIAWSATGLAAIALYVLVAALLGPQPWRTLQALAFAPAYLAWKVLMIPRTRLAARTGAAWVRTQRNAEALDPTIVDPTNPPS